MTAEASSTDTAESGASASGTATASVVLAVIRAGFSSALGDQLIAKRPIRVATEHPTQTLRRGAAPFHLGLVKFGRMSHECMLPPESAIYVRTQGRRQTTGRKSGPISVSP
jgi:hypothetical protein